MITKKDLVEEEWLELVMEEVKEAVQDTVLAGHRSWQYPLIPERAWKN